MDKNETLQQWLQKGADDFRSAEYLATMTHPTPDEIICFHCQQSAEKYLKGFLFFHNIEPPKIHDLTILLEMCEEKNSNFSVLSLKTDKLTEFAVFPRYPNELGITTEDMKTAIQYAKDVQEFVLKAIGEK